VEFKFLQINREIEKMKIKLSMKDGELFETTHPFDMDLIVIHKRIKDRVFTTCFSPMSEILRYAETEDVKCARFSSYDEWKCDQRNYLSMCQDSDRHMGDGNIFTTEGVE
jgi:hypothetical protein